MNKKCPKCGKEIPQYWYFHKECGWDAEKELPAKKVTTEDKITEKKEDFNLVIESSEKIATIGSPSSTNKLFLNILGTAAGKRLVGELTFFKFMQDGKPHYAIGQIAEIKLRNIWLEDATIKSVIRQKGYVSPLSDLQDTHLGDMSVSAIFKHENDKFDAGILGTVPSTGTPIYLMTDKVLDMLLAKHRSEIFYLGSVYGSRVKLPFWFKHFEPAPGRCR